MVASLLAKVFLASVTLTVCQMSQGHDLTTTPGDSGGDCVGCARQQQQAEMTEEEMRNVQIELIKLKILRGLNLDAPPEVNASLHSTLPSPLRLEMFPSGQLRRNNRRPRRHRRHNVNDDDDDRLSVIQKVAIRAEPSNDHSGSHQHVLAESGIKTFTFKLVQGLQGYKVRQAKLWLYVARHSQKAPNETATLFVSDTSGIKRWITEKPGVPGIIVTKAQAAQDGWMTLDLSSTVQRWLDNGHQQRKLTVTDVEFLKTKRAGFQLLDTDEFTPFLIINTQKPAKRSRRKPRNVCFPQNGCCRTPLVFNMQEIRWDHWVYEPQSYNAYYCRGSCSTMHRREYADGLQRYLQHHVHPQVDAQIAPCCAAVEMSPISIIYIDRNNNYIYGELQNMRVDSCDCR